MEKQFSGRSRILKIRFLVLQKQKQKEQKNFKKIKKMANKLLSTFQNKASSHEAALPQIVTYAVVEKEMVNKVKLL